MSDSEPVTVKEINDAVLKIVQDGNQDAITTRSVTEDIIKMFGDRLGDMKANIRGVVRAQLKVLVESEIVVSNPKSEGGTPKRKAKQPVDVPSGNVENVESSSKISGNTNNVGKINTKNADESEDKGVKEDEDEEGSDTEKKSSVNKKDQGNTVKNEDEEEDAKVDDDDDVESKEDPKDSDFNIEESVVVKRGRGRHRKRVPDEAEDSAESAASSEKPAAKRQRRSKSTPTSKMSAAEKRYKRYLKICSAIGCRCPPSKFRGKGMKEKADIVAEFLMEKGIDVTESIPREKELRKLRSKLASERELAMLDEGNIISAEGRRPRRNAAQNVSYSDKYEMEKAVEEAGIEHELPPSSPEQVSDSEGYVASVASSDDD